MLLLLTETNLELRGKKCEEQIYKSSNSPNGTNDFQNVLLNKQSLNNLVLDR